MNDLENKITELLVSLVPSSEIIEFSAIIDDCAFSMEFYDTEKGEKKQCYELIDSGDISEKELDKCFEKIADLIRKSDKYKSGEINKTYFKKSIGFN